MRRVEELASFNCQFICSLMTAHDDRRDLASGFPVELLIQGEKGTKSGRCVVLLQISKKWGGIFLSHWGKYNYFEENRLHERKHLQRQHHTPLAFMTSMASKTCQSPSFYKAYHPVLRCTVVLAKEVHRDIGQKKAVKLGSHYDTKQHETHFILFFAFQYN